MGSASLIPMPARWSADSVLDLAPDESSRRSATGLGRPAPWSGTGVAGDVLWGLCAGSGKNPYQTIVDLSGPAYKCSCPSRKFPCKHALGLLLNWANGSVPEESAPADFAARLAGRPPRPSGKGRKDHPPERSRLTPRWPLTRAPSRTKPPPRAGLNSGCSGWPAAWPSFSPGSGTRSGSACRPRRAADRGTPTRSRRGWSTRRRPASATALRGLSAVPASGEGWPGRLLGEYAQLHLLARAHERLDSLPPELAATVRSRVGYPIGRKDVLTRPAVTDHWAVLGRPRPGGRGRARAAHLAARARQRAVGDAADVQRARRDGGWQDPDTARLRPGTELHASLHYYPGQPPLRAVAGERHGPAGPGATPCCRRRRPGGPAGRIRRRRSGKTRG